MIGSTIDGKYEVMRLLGEGGMGAVYEARHTGTGRTVAVKALRAEFLEGNAEMLERFQREARAVGSLDTPHIVQVMDTGKDEATGCPYMVMELLAGDDLGRTVARLGPLHPDVALRIVAQACIGLEKAHDAGIVHRDIKPANVFLARRGGEVVVKLVDFGIAKVKGGALGADQDQALTRTGSLLGSPLYMSPEQAQGLKTVDHRTDLWSLGCVLYEALCARSPYAHVQTLGQIILALCSQPPTPVQDFAPWVSPEVAAIVHGCLYLDVEERFQSARELRSAIVRILGTEEKLLEGQLRSLTPDERARPAARFAGAQTRILGSGGPSPPRAPVVDVLPPEGPAPPRIVVEPVRVSPWLPFSIVAFGVLIFGGKLAYEAMHKVSDHIDSIGTQTAPASSTPDRVSTASTKEEMRTVYVGITPPTASVEIDGTPVELDKGAAMITAGLGSVHHVKIMVGKKESVSDVTLTPDGPQPPRVAFDGRARKDGGTGKDGGAR